MKNFSYFVIALLSVVLLVVIFKLVTTKPSVTIVNEVRIKSIDLEVGIIREELNEYDELSNSIKNEITEAIKEAAERYIVPPMLLHAIFQIESEYRFSINHPTITVKGKKTSAIGLGGIVWEYWSRQLIENDIAEKRSDLYIPRINILSTGFILRQIINDEVKKKATESNIISRVIAQYYGVSSPSYEKKMVKVTSHLWLKRMAREMANPKYVIIVEAYDSTSKSWKVVN